MDRSHIGDPQNGNQQLNVLSYDSPEGPRGKPEVVVAMPKNPQALAVQQTPDGSSACYVAISEAPLTDGAASPIEVFTVSVEGSYRSLYRLKGPSACYSLSFCHRTATYLLSGQVDGLIVVYDLLSGTTSMCHDNPGRGFRSICTDRSLIVSAEENYFRIFNVPAAELAS